MCRAPIQGVFFPWRKDSARPERMNCSFGGFKFLIEFRLNARYALVICWAVRTPRYGSGPRCGNSGPSTSPSLVMFMDRVERGLFSNRAYKKKVKRVYWFRILMQF